MLRKFWRLNFGTRVLIIFLLAQVVTFWMTISAAAEFLHSKALLTTTACRILFVLWPLPQLCLISLGLKSTEYVNKSLVTAGAVYGSLLLTVVNPYFVESRLTAFLISQAWFCGLAWLVLETES